MGGLMTDRNIVNREVPSVSRRAFLRVGAGVAAAVAVFDPLEVMASYSRGFLDPVSSVREVSVVNINTREHLSVAYWSQGRYVNDALRALNHVLRDHHDGSIHAMDPRLVDLMYGVFRLTGGCGPVEVVCGYRSPRTNARMHASRRGVAKNSMHVQGKAVDIRLPSCGLEALHRAALALRAGGVGYYPRSNFVHIDTGAVRTWGGHDAEEDYGEMPEWRDALLSDTPQVQQAADAGLLPGSRHPAVAADVVVAPRSRVIQAPALPGHKPVRVAMRSGPAVQSEGFWVRRKPRFGRG